MPVVVVEEELRALEVAFEGRIGAYAVDTGTGRSVAYRAGERFPLLSTFKAPLCAAVLCRARRERGGLMGRRLRWRACDMTPNSPVTGRHLEGGLTVAELCAAAVTRSDGTASNLLMELIGGPRGMTAFFRGLGDAVSRVDRWHPGLNEWVPGDERDTTTPAAMAGVLRALAVGGALHPEDRQRLVGWLLASQVGAGRVPAGLPAGWTVGHKTGTNSDGFGGGHDVAVVWTEAGAAPIVMAVYTNRTPGLPTDDSVLARTAKVLVRALGERGCPTSRGRGCRTG
ncbi:hypothetical protein BKM31_16835 [[Actinomadura] parvosata subsp. kistnae]|uniref:Beta-lactamase n=1 Tax=[Actinomadura] parvosata subsp. kistnae TaxID=1909395 RepID=A0A1U9ZY68_9ACTN|nr:class A beta-lactamase [Nonomuraea sp. ATCC 55076]AQZ62903.1 hypothetical protein BKM31_16835 [Nonomuraea sp. ATCC 55076]